MSRERNGGGTVVEVPRPVMRSGRPHCPRCDARLLFDGEELLCLACGYEYVPDEREVTLMRGERRRAGSPMMLLAPGILLGLALGTAGLVLAGAGLVLLLLRGGRFRGGR